jgi:type IV pilus assembly protein PilM
MFSSSTPPRSVPTDDPDSKDPSRSAEASEGLARWRTGWFRGPPLLGMDIGTAAIKLVELRRSRGSIALGKIAIAETPGEALSGGALTNSIAAAGALREALRAHRIRCRRAALAVGGAKARAQCEAVPAESFESEEAMRAYVERTASSQIDSDVDFAALDYHTVAAPSGGPGTVVWACSGGAEVDWARQAAALAGRVPVLVEPRACSLANAYVFNHEPEDGRASLLLHSGARWLTLALVLDGLLLYSRDVPLPDTGGAEGLPDAAMILGALRPHLHAIAGRAAPAKIDRLVMSGAARADQSGEAIHRDTGLMVQQMEPFRRISHPAAGPDGEMVREWAPVFSVAAGLALRGFEDL